MELLMGYAVDDSLFAGELCRGGAWDPRGDGVAQEDGHGLYEREGHGPEGVLRGHGCVYSFTLSHYISIGADSGLLIGLNEIVQLDAKAGGKAFEQV